MWVCSMKKLEKLRRSLMILPSLMSRSGMLLKFRINLMFRKCLSTWNMYNWNNQMILVVKMRKKILILFVRFYCPTINTTYVRYYVRPIAPRCHKYECDLFERGGSDHKQLEVNIRIPGMVMSSQLACQGKWKASQEWHAPCTITCQPQPVYRQGWAGRN